MDGKNFDSKIPSLSTDEKSHAEAAYLLQEAFNSKKEKLDLSNRLLAHIPASIGKLILALLI